ncbi:MAG: CAP domain-containing protein [Paracoccaceae bacterium]
MERILMTAVAIWAATAVVAAADCAMPRGGSAARAALAEAVNGFRDGRGLPRLTVSRALENAATGHACGMVARDRFSHEGGGGLRARVRRAGCRANLVGETIAMGNTDAGATLQQWINSPPHRRILLSKGMRVMGIGLAAPRRGQGGGPRWVLDVADGC